MPGTCYLFAFLPALVSPLLCIAILDIEANLPESGGFSKFVAQIVPLVIWVELFVRTVLFRVSAGANGAMYLGSWSICCQLLLNSLIGVLSLFILPFLDQYISWVLLAIVFKLHAIGFERVFLMLGTAWPMVIWGVVAVFFGAEPITWALATGHEDIRAVINEPHPYPLLLLRQSLSLLFSLSLLWMNVLKSVLSWRLGGLLSFLELLLD